MTVLPHNQLINEILKSPSAPILINKIRAVLEEEQERRLIFYNEITEQEKAEFINGEIIIHSPVRKVHNEINGNLYKIVDTYVLEHELGFVGFEKILIQCTRNDYEPDLCFFNKTTAKSFKKEQALFPIPDMIVEVLSKGTEKRDRGVKFEDYQNHGVQEYWLINPKNQTIEQYLLNAEGRYELQLKSNSGQITVATIQGLVIPIPTIFDEKLSHQFVRAIYQK